MSGPVFHTLKCWKQVLTHVGVGMGAASFWRGAWYVLDDNLFPDDPNMSAISSLALGTGGMAASQGIVARAMAVQGRMIKPVARFGALYTIAMSCVLVWRGTWVGWDCLYEHFHNIVDVDQINSMLGGEKKEETPAVFTTNTSAPLMATSTSFLEHSLNVKSTDPGHLTASGMASHVFAIVALMAGGVFASVLAPPAAVSVIKDLAIKVSRPAASSSGGAFKRSSTNHALEFVPHLAASLRTTSRVLKTRSMATSARGFKGATTGHQVKRYL